MQENTSIQSSLLLDNRFRVTCSPKLLLLWLHCCDGLQPGARSQRQTLSLKNDFCHSMLSQQEEPRQVIQSSFSKELLGIIGGIPCTTSQ